MRSRVGAEATAKYDERDACGARGARVPQPHRSTRRRTKTLVHFFCLTAMLVGVVSVPQFALPQTAQAATTVTDNFNRADGSLGAGWTDMSGGEWPSPRRC